MASKCLIPDIYFQNKCRRIRCCVIDKSGLDK
jgi:hypothetical protein